MKRLEDSILLEAKFGFKISNKNGRQRDLNDLGAIPTFHIICKDDWIHIKNDQKFRRFKTRGKIIKLHFFINLGWVYLLTEMSVHLNRVLC